MKLFTNISLVVILMLLYNSEIYETHNLILCSTVIHVDQLLRSCNTHSQKSETLEKILNFANTKVMYVPELSIYRAHNKRAVNYLRSNSAESKVSPKFI